MSSPIISVENLGKRYLVGHQSERERYTALRDVIARNVKNFARTTRDLFRGRQIVQGDEVEEFWALKNVSFEVQPGEVVGIIGRNGAGKSTLLKILSRITEPSEGRITLRGRVASLLEVGTGFHPELSGRENIFLNGAILGMTRAEIKGKFDEIVAFAEVEKFLDTPVKRYSSGMYVRLAFAVAAHLDPEILVVDEVLAVGDAAFQKKCLGKMQDVAAEGRTVLFVSHNMAALTALTKKGILLKGGSVEHLGDIENCIELYLHQVVSAGVYISEKSERKTPHISQIIFNSKKTFSTHLSGDSINISFRIEHVEPLKGACFSFQIVNQFQQPVVHCWIYDADTPFCRQPGPTTLNCIIPRLSLNVGRYSLTTYLSESPGGLFFEKIENICHFNVEMVGRQTLFQWRPEACCYLEDFKWTNEQ